MILLMILLGFNTPARAQCEVLDCSLEACETDGECLIDTPEGEVCHPQRRVWVDGRERYWREEDHITCPVSMDIEPT